MEKLIGRESLVLEKERNMAAFQFVVFTHVTFALTTVGIRHVGAQTNALNREIIVRK